MDTDPGNYYRPQVTQWQIVLVVTEAMPYTEEIRKHIVADRLMTAVPNSNVRVKSIVNMTEQETSE